MDRLASQAITTEIPLFRDGLGERFLLADNNGRPVQEALLVRAEIAAVPAFEYALNLRIKELESFQHPSFVRVQSLARTPGRLPRLSLLSDYVPGQRLSEILTPGNGGVPGAGVPPSMPAALFLIRGILDAVAVLHRQAATTCHGALGPERIVIVDTRPRIVEYVLGSAIEQLQFSHDRYWNDLRIALPPSAGQARFDRRTDVAQVGMLALALFAGRLLKDEEHLGNVLGLLDRLSEPSQGGRAPLGAPNAAAALGSGLGAPNAAAALGSGLAPSLRSWLLKMLQLDLRRSYVSAVEAQDALEQVMEEAGVKSSAPSPALRQTQGAPSSSRGGCSPQETERVSIASRFETKNVAPRAASAAKPQQAARRPSRREYLDRLERPGSWGRFFLHIFIIVGLTAGAFAVARIVPPPGTWVARSGTIVIDSTPQGAIIMIDGERRGITPATITIAPGQHKMDLRAGGQARTVDVMVPAGGKIVETVELRPAGRR
jgi:hypothetical protein